MSFSSIFQVNGQDTAACIDFQSSATFASSSFLHQHNLSNGAHLMITVPLGEMMFSSSLIVCAAQQNDDIVLG